MRIAAWGWIPAVLAYTVAVWLLRDLAGVGLRHSLAFTAWTGWTLTVPGTVVWRVLCGRHRTDRRPSRLLEDLTLGTTIGTVLLVPVYLLCVGLGLPLLHLAWPLLVMGAAASTAPGRRALLARRGRLSPRRDQLWWPWTTALLIILVLGWVGYSDLAPRRLSPLALRSMYIDMPFHLALTADFRHHALADFPYVAGTTLRYHWFVYPLFAAASWGSGVEPEVIVLLLGPLALAVLALLTTGMAAHRLVRHRTSALLAMASLALLTPWDGLGWTPWSAPVVRTRWIFFESPTTMLAAALTALVLLLVLEILRRRLEGVAPWLLLGGVMLAAAGAKSTVMPLLIGGLAGTTLVMWLVRRSLPRRLAGMTVLAVLVFLLAVVIFYGSGSRSLTLAPFQLVDRTAEVTGSLTDGAPAPLLRSAILLAGVLAHLLLGATTVGLFVRRGWRHPAGWIVLGCCSAAYLLATVLAHPGYSQGYFLWAMMPVAAIGAALGADRLWQEPARAHLGSGALAASAGLVTVVLVAPLTSPQRPGVAAATESARAWVSWTWPVVALVLCIVLVAVTARLASRRWPALRGRATWIAATFALGMCLLGPVGYVQQVLTAPAPGPPTRYATIGPSGVSVARWLRDHSAPDDLVATNLHARRPHFTPPDRRQFWISAFAERRVLVEGWSYIPPELVGLPSNEETNDAAGGPFWEPEVLAANDLAFAHPTAANLAVLRRDHGVTWLFVDARHPVDLAALTRHADHVHGDERYQVFRLRNLG